jgi:predicted deacylase
MPLIHRQEIAGAADGPRLLITGGVHGDEYEPMAAIRQLARILRPESLRGRVTLVPVVNEPAFRLAARTAEDGLDLARTCPGRSDGCVTERIAHELSGLIREADYYIDLHTGGARLRVLPLTGYMLHPDPAILEAQRKMAVAFGLPLAWGTDPTLPGRSLSVARDAGVPAIYAEYQGGGELDRDGVDAYVTGCLNVMTALEMLDGLPREAISPRIVEDPRPGSGHMQVCHPLPHDGFFAAEVRLGQEVRAGERFGIVSDPLGSRETEIQAERSGVVVVLRACPSVLQGESAGVILEPYLPPIVTSPQQTR